MSDYSAPVDSFSVKIEHDGTFLFEKRYSIKDDRTELLEECDTLMANDDVEVYGIQ